jgi:1-phosphofructokinase
MSATASIVTVTLNPAIDQTLDIPGFAAGQVNRVASSEAHAGGKGVNVAGVLADLGAGVAVTGFLGQGNAQLFEAMFRDKGIDDRFVRIPGDTRVGIKIIDGPSGRTTDINFPGLAPPPEAFDDLCRRVDALSESGRWFALCGSLPPGIGADAYARLTDIVHAKGGSVGLDTSGAALREAIARGPDVTKPNLDELAELAGRPLDTTASVVDAARTLLLQHGVRLAVVSMGAAGAVFVDADQALVARPPRVAVKSTVGAGDAMVAGVVYGQHRGLPIDQCARLATALGAHAVTRLGAGLGRPPAHEGLLRDVTIEPVQ